MDNFLGGTVQPCLLTASVTNVHTVIAATLLIIDDCIIHQTRLASGKTLHPAALQVVFLV